MKQLSYRTKSFVTVLIIFTIILFSFWNESPNNIYPAIEVNDSSIGYYQSTTCNISLFNVVVNNINNSQKIKYNNNNYAGIDCFGKVTGLDKVEDIYIVSIGTNSSITLLIQTFIWCLILLLISKFKFEIEKINLFYIIFLSIFFTTQQFSEDRYYLQVNKNFDLSYSYNNYYLINIFLVFYITFVFISIFYENNKKYIFDYFPYMFLVVGAFNGFNLNFFSLLFSYIGLKVLFEKKSNNFFNTVYISYFVVWTQTTRDEWTYFDTDKLKGFINSSNNKSSLIFWGILFYFILNGLIYLSKNSEFNFNVICKNLLISSNLIFIFGILGAVSPLVNFLNYISFGQNKRGINSLSSIDGNTWRGFSSSAESIGEFYGFVILFCFIAIYLKKFTLNKLEVLFIFLPLYGLFRSNNFAVILSLIFLIFLILIYKYMKNYNKNKIYIITSITFISGMYLLITKLGFEYVSTQLLYEASLHSDFFPNLSNDAKVNEITKFYNARQIMSLFSLTGQNTSTFLNFLFQSYQQNSFNIPLVPNIVTFISFVSILINRNEMWGIFSAKYNPNFLEASFGNGPYQLNNYLYKLKIRLDVPEGRLDSLYLPHSSFLDLFIFFGFIGFFLFVIWNFYMLKTKIINPELKILLIFLLLNFAKSDSLLYMNSLILLTFSYMIIYKSRINEN